MAAARSMVCIGWGSLVWKPGNLRVQGPWCEDGPVLPLEFSRTSDHGNGRLTLVITPGAREVTTLWAALDYPDSEEAIAALVRREGCWRGGIGVWPGDSAKRPPGWAAIDEWSRDRGFDLVVWTALPPMFGGERGRGPGSAVEAIAYLEQRDPRALKDAEEYVRRAPAQVRTAYREEFERHFGWTPI